MPTQYHRIFVPCPDIFALSGLDVLTQLGKGNPDNKNLVVISAALVDELNELKQREGSEGAADALRFLHEQRTRCGPLSKEGISVGEVATGLDVAFIQKRGKRGRGISDSELDKLLSSQYHARPVFLTNDDRNHIDFLGRGMQVEEAKFLQVSADIVREGMVLGNAELQAHLHQQGGRLPLEEAVRSMGQELRLNQFVRFSGSTHYEYARVHGTIVRDDEDNRIIEVKAPVLELLDPKENSKRLRIGDHHSEHILGIRPRDMEQYLALQYGLLNPEVELFFLCGSQGSGKTLLTYVAAVDQVLFYSKEMRTRRGMSERTKGGLFKHLVLLKPNEVLGGSRRDVGALPGSLYEKLRPHLEPYIDAHEESILGSLFPFEQMLYHPRFAQNGFEQRSKEATTAEIGSAQVHLPSWEVMQMTYSGFMRGRSFRDTILIVDEAQNFTPYEVKTICERAGEGSKVIVMGDPLQTDNPHCSREVNGLTHAIKHYLGEPNVALLNLTRHYRSQVSDRARSWQVFSR